MGRQSLGRFRFGRGLSRPFSRDPAGSFFLTFFPPYDQRFPDVLNRSSTQFGANGCQYRIPLDAIFPVNAYLDKFVSLKRVVDFLEHRRGQPVAGNADHGMKMMGLRAKRSPLCGREINHFTTH